jgi:hypothetical protein
MVILSFMPGTSTQEHITDTSNMQLEKATRFIKYTNENLFLTGKAGTGKTTFLKYIKNNINKQVAVIAPTGVAAINAGGETIHSFLQLPFTPFVPGNLGGFNSNAGVAEDKHSLLAKLRLRDTKKKLLQKLEVLIIDEISMVRCDLLDCIDLVLRHTRKKWTLPFGGVQMVFIGDMFQLPPVIPDHEWQILRDFYRSPYFFDSIVLQENPPVYIELKKIYRQKEQTFINILNNIRTGQPSQYDIDTLNNNYDPSFRPADKEGYITLSTHNRTVDDINQIALEQLKAPLHVFEGMVKNEFNPKNLPTEQNLQLKEGAQVMFVKNDTQTPRRYYNGKIGTIHSITDQGIRIGFIDEFETILLEKETWKNMRYALNAQKGEIEEEEVGSFTQYPIRLAWAVTVHKSQGLTFDKVIVDLSRSFASGQVYVALSRCTSLAGLILRTRLSQQNVMVDERIVSFAQNEANDEMLDQQLEQGMLAASSQNLSRLFSFAEELEQIETLQKELGGKKTGPAEENQQLAEELYQAIRRAHSHGENFGRQIQGIIHNSTPAYLAERKQAAVNYFVPQVLDPCIQRINQHLVLLSGYKKVLKQTRLWKDLNDVLKKKMTHLKSEITQ